MADEHRSIVDFRGRREFYRCGYCRTHGKVSTGMWAHKLTVHDYQDLIDRGWRRSGKYCYKPVMHKTCCPQYTIRCTANDLTLNKSHKRVIKRFNRYLNTDIPDVLSQQKQSVDTLSAEGVDMADVPAEMLTARADSGEVTEGDIDTSRLGGEGAASGGTGGGTVGGPGGGAVGTDAPAERTTSPEECMSCSPGGSDRGSTLPEDSLGRKDTTKKSPRPGAGADPNRPHCGKAKERRRERWRQKHGQTQEAQAKTSKLSETKTLERLLREISSDSKHKLEVRLVRSSPRSEEFEASFEESFTVYKKYQMAIHGDPPEKPTQRQYTSFLVESPLQVRLVRSSPPSATFTETLEESYAVYRRYQMAVHHTKPDTSNMAGYMRHCFDCDMDSYVSFLVNSPLEPYYREGGFPEGFGSFHQHYLIDNKIIAVGVIDILPGCVSSVYLYYDPDYHFLSLGTYTALQELAYVRHLFTMEPSIEYYYMGFYIHSCPKMRYKGQYVPSFLLCPETFDWIPIESCRPKLDAKKYCRLHGSPDAEDAQGTVDVDKVLVLFARQAMPYQFYVLLNQEADDEREVLKYAGFVGRDCSERMLLYRS